MAGQNSSNEEMFNASTEETTFDFGSLPWVIQRRFAEVCDGGTLKTFAAINSYTRELSKRCHSIEFAQIQNGGICCLRISCKCVKPCTNIDLSKVKGKLHVSDRIFIFNKAKEEEKTAHYFLNLPVSLKSNEKLSLIVDTIEFDVLNDLITPNLRRLYFNGTIQFKMPKLDEFKNFLWKLTKLDQFRVEFDASSFPFQTQDLGRFIRRKHIESIAIQGTLVVIQNNYY